MSSSSGPMCSICLQSVVDGISMTCQARHSYCCKCIMSYFEKAESPVKFCPYCKSSSNYLLMSQDPKYFGEYSTGYIIKSLDPLSKIDPSIQTNTCLISFNTIMLIINNKEQLELYFKNIDDEKYKEKPDALIKLIKWDKGDSRSSNFRNVGSLADDFIGSVVRNLADEFESSATISPWYIFSRPPGSTRFNPTNPPA